MICKYCSFGIPEPEVPVDGLPCKRSEGKTQVMDKTCTKYFHIVRKKHPYQSYQCLSCDKLFFPKSPPPPLQVEECEDWRDEILRIAGIELHPAQYGQIITLVESTIQKAVDAAVREERIKFKTELDKAHRNYASNSYAVAAILDVKKTVTS